MRALMSLALLATLLAVVLAAGSPGSPGSALARADLESALPAPGAVVQDAPLTVEVVFSEPVVADGLAVHVVDEDGGEVQAGSAELDLSATPPRRATVALRANLPEGEYTVEWKVTSAVDGEETTGAYAFDVSGRPVTPSPAGATPPPALPRGSNGNILAGSDYDFDGRRFGLSVGAGLFAAVAIAVFWRAVRPRNPTFGGRARG